MCAGLVVALVAPASSAASLGGIYGNYTTNGSIDGCKYSAGDLQNALGSVPTDIQQYDPGFVNALNKALAQRSNGCSSGGTQAVSGSSKSSPGGRTTAADGSPKPPGLARGSLAANRSVSPDSGLPPVVALLAGLVGLILAGGAAIAFVRRFGWPPTSLRRRLAE